MSRDQIATVRSWDPARGTGLLCTRAGEDVEISRELLVDSSDLTVGDRVAFRQAYEPVANEEWGWTFHDVRVVSEDEASTLELDAVCRDAEYAEGRMRTAQQLASDDDAEIAREDFLRANATRRQRVGEIGRELYMRGGEPAMRRVLDGIDAKNRSSVATDWQGIVDDMSQRPE